MSATTSPVAYRRVAVCDIGGDSAAAVSIRSITLRGVT